MPGICCPSIRYSVVKPRHNAINYRLAGSRYRYFPSHAAMQTASWVVRATDRRRQTARGGWSPYRYGGCPGHDRSVITDADRIGVAAAAAAQTERNCCSDRDLLQTAPAAAVTTKYRLRALILGDL